jgi:hypothetical protein
MSGVALDADDVEIKNAAQDLVNVTKSGTDVDD